MIISTTSFLITVLAKILFGQNWEQIGNMLHIHNMLFRHLYIYIYIYALFPIKKRVKIIVCSQ